MSLEKLGNLGCINELKAIKGVKEGGFGEV